MCPFETVTTYTLLVIVTTVSHTESDGKSNIFEFSQGKEVRGDFPMGNLF